MKKFYFLVCFSFMVVNSWGQLLTEDFNYTAGQLLTANGWTAHSGTGTNSIAVTSPGLTYSGLQGSGIGNAALVENAGGEDVNQMFTSQNTDGQSIYFSGLLSVTESLDKSGDYILHIGNATSPTSFSSFAARVFVRTTATGVNFGISNSSTATFGTTDFSRNTVYLIIVKYTINVAGNDDVSLWVKSTGVPSTEAAAGSPEVTASNSGQNTINAIALRQGSSTTSPQTVVDALKVGLTWADVTPGVATPSLTVSPLTAFGNVCINTTAGPNSFTISGSNLTTANVTVGALLGFTYSTTAGGTYTPTLNLSQPGGTYSQQVFVKFTPTVVQSYSGNIAVGGGGATSVNEAASGAGVNSIPSLTTGAASAITQTTATVAGTITSVGCTSVTAYGIEYSTTMGFTPGTGTQTASTNLAGGNFTSGLTTLASATTYYYRAYATNTAGTGYGTEMSFSTVSASPTITNTALTAFGNVCINTTAGPNSFTISGTNLTTANVTVGALAGFTYSTTAGGTYTPSLSLTQPGGTYTQQIFVRFTPTAIQSYNGNIPLAGGGIAATVNVAVSGAGVNTIASVTTGGASAITTTTATLAGSITATGCTAVTAYGIEYSTVNAFPNGTGTPVASTNLAAGNFTSAVSLLAPSTTYYYKAYATNGGGTAYGAQQSFTTAAPPPPVLTATALSAFTATCIATTSSSNTFTINGTNLTTASLSVGPLAGFTFSETVGGTYVSTLLITQAGGTQSKTVYVKFTPIAVQSYNGNIPVSGGGAATINVAAVASGVNTTATVSTGAASNLTNHSATLSGGIASNGCSNVTAYGVEYSGISGFVNGAGTKVSSTNLSGGVFSSPIAGLVQGATYYFKAYATNSGGTAYGVEQAFIVPSINNGFSLYPVPVERGTAVRVTMDNITPGYYGLQFFNSSGQLVYQWDMNIQVNFINQTFTVPGSIQAGTYRVLLVNHLGILDSKSILIH